MKTFSKSAIILVSLLILSLNGFSQKMFQGQIRYAISYEGMGLNESMKAMLPDEMVFFLKNNKSKSELKTGMGDQITIFDGNNKTSISLMDFAGRKVAVKKSVDEINLERKKYNDIKVIFEEETKVIEGYLCKKVTIEVNAADFNGENAFTVFYTDELGNTGINYGDPLFNQIDGVMLEYEIKARGLLMRFSATEIKEEALADEIFSIPADYKEMTKDELKKLFGR